MEELLPYYNRELAYLRKMGAEFAAKHPKIAGRLRMSGDQVEDPHVSRLIESFALLTARIRRKIDDDFPEIAEAMLGVLCPYLVKPFPAVAITQLRRTKATWATNEAQHVPRGSEIETNPIDGEPCRFRTCYPVELWPIQITEAAVAAMPTRAPATPFTAESAAVLRLRLETLSPKTRFADLPIGTLRLYLHGQSIYTTGLYEQLLNDAVGLAVASDDMAEAITLPPDAIEPVGFAEDEGLVDDDARSFLGYRLLAEHFVLPEKFLFVDVQLGAQTTQKLSADRALEVYVYLKRSVADLERNTDASTFRLGCTPIANLFEVRAEPIRLSGEVSEYRVVPDARRPLSHEVVAITDVTATAADDTSVPLRPLYSTEHGRAGETPLFWHSHRRLATAAEHRVDHGTEVTITPVDLDATPLRMQDGTLDVRVTCCNRDLPARLPFGGGQPTMRLGGGPAAEVECLTPPTKTLRPALGPGAAWRLASKLSLNHASLVGDAGALRELLSLYDFVGSDESRTLIEAVTDVSGRRVVGRVGASGAAFCQGVEVTITLDEERFSAGGRFLFASVLERFMALYAQLNSFVTTRVMTNRMDGPLKHWPPRAGDRPLL